MWVLWYKPSLYVPPLDIFCLIAGARGLFGRAPFDFVKDNHSLSEWIKSLKLWTKINSCNTIEATGNRNKGKTVDPFTGEPVKESK